MTSITDLYNNIKTLITKYFEEKTIEDETLPQWVELCFNYNQGNLNIGIHRMELTVTGSSFSTYSSTPFTYNGRVFVDWGDDTDLIEYAGEKLSHSYSANKTYTIKIYGDITSLSTNCFANCSGLTSIIIPDSVTTLGIGCFSNCSNLTSVIIPDSVTSLGINCFIYCTGLTSVLIPDSVTSLGDGCFYNCTGLTSVLISDSVTSLGTACFERCTGLTFVIIPDSVTSIGTYCFYECSSLTNINLNWDNSNKILTYDSDWIDEENSNLKFSIPNGTTSLYTTKEYPSNKLVESD